MFHAQRQRILNEASWSPWRLGKHSGHDNRLPSLRSLEHAQRCTREDDVQFVECWKYEGFDVAQPGVNCFSGIIHDEDIEDWLEQRGPFTHRSPDPDRPIVGGIRLLICEQRERDPITFPLSRRSFVSVEQRFRLSPATLPIFSNTGCSHTWRHNAAGRNELVFAVKAPQKDPVANYGLSFSHDLDTGITTGILCGRHTVDGDWRNSRGEYQYQPQLPQIRELLAASVALWAHPLLLPSLLLDNNIDRTQRFCQYELEGRLLRVEDELGVARATRLVPYHQKGIAMNEMMAEMNSVTTELVQATCVPAWQIRFAEFLEDVLEKTDGLLPQQTAEECTPELREMIEHMGTTAVNDRDFVEQLRSRMELQIDVLRNFMARTDNFLSAQLAATATRDSTAMKTLAFLATVFLPGIFVATLFSLSIFASTTNSTSSSSNNFRIFWAITIPLTILVMGCWRLWWEREGRRFKREYNAILQGRDPLKADGDNNANGPRSAVGVAAVVATATATAPAVPRDSKDEAGGGGVGAVAGAPGRRPPPPNVPRPATASTAPARRSASLRRSRWPGASELAHVHEVRPAGTAEGLV